MYTPPGCLCLTPLFVLYKQRNMLSPLHQTHKLATSETFHSMDHSTTKAIVKRKRMSKKHPPPQWGVVRGMLHMRIKDVSADLGVPISYLRRLCKENRYPKWPGKMIRYMSSTGRNLMLQIAAAPQGSPLAGFAGPSQPVKIAETKKEEEDHPPKEPVTLNLLDKVGSSSNSKNN